MNLVVTDIYDFRRYVEQQNIFSMSYSLQPIFICCVGSLAMLHIILLLEFFTMLSLAGFSFFFL